MGICSPKALRWGLGSALQWACVVPSPRGGAWLCGALGLSPTKTLRWGCVGGALPARWVGVGGLDPWG